MDEKIFDMLTKMYEEMQQGFKEIRKDILTIENKLDDNSKTLFDGYTQTYEKLTGIENKLGEISTKIEKQDVEIRVIKNVAK